MKAKTSELTLSAVKFLLRDHSVQDVAYLCEGKETQHRPPAVAGCCKVSYQEGNIFLCSRIVLFFFFYIFGENSLLKNLKVKCDDSLTGTGPFSGCLGASGQATCGTPDLQLSQAARLLYSNSYDLKRYIFDSSWGAGVAGVGLYYFFNQICNSNIKYHLLLFGFTL